MAKKSIFINEAGYVTTIYSSNSPATCTVGGITVGTVLTGQTMEYLMQEILAPYIEPAFSSFAVDIPSPMEVGAALQGTKTFTWGTSTCDNVATDVIGICEVGGALLGSSLSNDGSEALSIGTKTNTACCVWTWQVTGCSTQDTAFSRNVNKCSLYPFFYGVETSGGKPTVDNTLVNGGNKCILPVGTSVSVTFNSSDQWTWFAMPTICAARTKWFIAVGNCGFVDRGVPSDRYPDVCTLDKTDSGGCWSTISYEVYMSDFADTLAVPLYFRTS